MILAIDIGGTKIAAAMVDGDRIVTRRQVEMPRHVDGFRDAIGQLVTGLPVPELVAVAATGFIREGCIHAVNRSIISFWDGFALQALLAQHFTCPITMLNDAQAAAWAEYLAGEASFGSVLYLTLSTGVGGGLVVDHRLQIGRSGLAGHIGHNTVSTLAVDGVTACGCGRTACLEMVASGTAIARQGSFIFGESMDSQEVFARAAVDSRAEQILVNAANAVAEAIANCVMLLNVECAVIGGSVGLAPGMVGRIRSALQSTSDLVRIPVTKARLGADSGLMGAARWAAREDQEKGAPLPEPSRSTMTL